MRWGLSRGRTALFTLALALFVAFPALANDSVTLTINGGGRSANVTEAQLEPVNYSHEDQSSAGTIGLTVDDSSATSEGWNVTIQAGDFVGANNTIPAGNFSITSANAPTYGAGQEIDTTGGPKVPASGAAGSLDTPRKVLQADAGFGAGTYQQVLNVELLVPGQTTAGDYTSNLTVNITAGP